MDDHVALTYLMLGLRDLPEERSFCLLANMNYSLNSFKGGYIGDYIGDYYRGY